MYSTEGDNYKRTDFNIKSIFIQGSQDQRTKAPSTPLEPIQPFEPGPGPIKPPSTIQRIREFTERPGGIDPYYRSRDTTQTKNQYRLYKEQVNLLKDQVE